MKSSIYLFIFCMVIATASVVGAGPEQEPDGYQVGSSTRLIALETTAGTNRLLPTLIKAVEQQQVKQEDAKDASELLGAHLSKVFAEGAVRLDPPVVDQAASENVDGGIPTGGREISVMAYSYCLNGRTASGRYTAPGIVAVDTRVIPMGSKLYIPGYGWGVAADTGGAIVGNKIDVWYPSLAQCYQWGVRPVKIKVFPRR